MDRQCDRPLDPGHGRLLGGGQPERVDLDQGLVDHGVVAERVAKREEGVLVGLARRESRHGAARPEHELAEIVDEDVVRASVDDLPDGVAGGHVVDEGHRDAVRRRPDVDEVLRDPGGRQDVGHQARRIGPDTQAEVDPAAQELDDVGCPDMRSHAILGGLHGETVHETREQ